MNENVHVFITQLPTTKASEMVMPDADGHTIYIDDRLSPAGRQRAYLHALKHIGRNDFDEGNVQHIETEAHKNEAS